MLFCFYLFTESLKFKSISPLTLIFFHKIVLELLSPLYYHVNFELVPQFLQKGLWGLIGI